MGWTSQLFQVSGQYPFLSVSHPGFLLASPHYDALLLLILPKLILPTLACRRNGCHFLKYRKYSTLRMCVCSLRSVAAALPSTLLPCSPPVYPLPSECSLKGFQEKCTEESYFLLRICELES